MSCSVANAANVVDLNAMLDWFVSSTKLWVPWLADDVAVNDANNATTPDTSQGPRVFPVDPGNVYNGPMPYLVWLAPRGSVAWRDGELGNIKGKPNAFVASYRESPYVDKTDTMLYQRRMYDTFGIIASNLRPIQGMSNPCPPDGLNINDVYLEHGLETVYIATPSQMYVGALFVVEVETRYT